MEPWTLSPFLPIDLIQMPVNVRFFTCGVADAGVAE